MYLNEDRDDVAFLTAGSGSSESRINSKRDLYERGHVAVCSHRQAICITVFVFASIMTTSLIVAFARPWNDCGGFKIPELVDETPVIPTATNGELFPWDNVRLPIFVRPLSYDLELSPSLDTLNVTGIIKLIFQVTEETDFIIFHAKGMNITSKTINEKIKIERLLFYPARDQVYLETSEPMKPGRNYSVRLKFVYKLAEGLQGFYLSTYKDKAGNTRKLATTHFEPTSARAAFPCFDEPQLKAKFLVTIIHDRSLKSFFNMPQQHQSAVRGKKNQIRTEFEESKEMSTYLVAFVICDFDLIQKQTDTNITISVIAAKDKIDQAEFALEQATLITQNYEKYFGVKYPLPKQDLIAIPDFGAGAMENWGLITYRETSLLYQEGKSSSGSQQWVATVIAHELAHQWFGNLVTMQWWNDLWLNEGFASWMEYKGVNGTKPEWRMMDQFWSRVVQPALGLDSLTSSHPISVPVNDPKDIEGIFDTISYKKGSSIIHMLEKFIGPENLRAGLGIYLNRHKFKNAVTKDLWSALAEATNYTKDVEGMMNTWTLQMGYPVISFIQNGNTTSWNITQERFLLSKQVNGTNSSLPESRYDYTWVVPFDYTTNDGKTGSIVLSKKKNQKEAKINLADNLKWFKANTEGYGYYRVNYPTKIWAGLIAQLKADHTVFSAADRAQMIDDAFSLCTAGDLPYDIPVSMVQYLSKETDYVPWSVALRQLGHWKVLFREGEGRVPLDRLVSNLMENLYTSLGWEDKGDHLQRLLRSLVLTAMFHAHQADAAATSLARFNQEKDDNVVVPVEIQEVVYCSGISQGDREDWDWAYKQYTTTNIPSRRRLILSALACSRDTIILQEYLDMTLNKDQVRSQDVRTVLGGIASNPSGRLLAWRHLRRHWDKYYDLFGSGSFTLGAIIKGVIGGFSTRFDLQQVEEFFSSRALGAGERALLQAKEHIKVNIMFRERSEKLIVDWMNRQLDL